MTKFYAVAQAYLAVYGSGASTKAALEDAKQWLAPGYVIEPLGYRNRCGDTLALYECTQELHERLQANGFDFIFEFNEEGLLDICLD